MSDADKKYKWGGGGGEVEDRPANPRRVVVVVTGSAANVGDAVDEEEAPKGKLTYSYCCIDYARCYDAAQAWTVPNPKHYGGLQHCQSMCPQAYDAHAYG